MPPGQAGWLPSPRHEWRREGAESTLPVSPGLRPQGVWQDPARRPLVLGLSDGPPQPATKHCRKHIWFWQDQPEAFSHLTPSPSGLTTLTAFYYLKIEWMYVLVYHKVIGKNILFQGAQERCPWKACLVCQCWPQSLVQASSSECRNRSSVSKPFWNVLLTSFLQPMRPLMLL